MVLTFCVNCALHSCLSRRTSVIIICAEQQGMLLPWLVCQALGILPDNYPDPKPDDRQPFQCLCQHIATRPENCPKSTIKTGNRRQQARQPTAEFSDVFDTTGPLHTGEGPPMRIELLEGAVSVSIHRAGPKSAFDTMAADGVIAAVAEPTELTRSIVVAQKSHGTVPICIDLTRLNRYVQRPFHPPRSLKDVGASISQKARYFTLLDAVQGYHQIPLHEECQPLTIFITPWGRFQLLRGTMGLNATGDEYNRRGDEALSDSSNSRHICVRRSSTSTAHQRIATALPRTPNHTERWQKIQVCPAETPPKGRGRGQSLDFQHQPTSLKCAASWVWWNKWLIVIHTSAPLQRPYASY